MAASSENADKGKTTSTRPPFLEPPTQEILEYFVDRILSCDSYRDEYKDCKKFWTRVDQNYVYGQDLDCNHLKTAYDACQKMREDPTSRQYILAYEKAKSEFRVEHAGLNDVWEYRTQADKKWTKDLSQAPLQEFKKLDNNQNYIRPKGLSGDSNYSNNTGRIVARDNNKSVTQNEIESKNDNSVSESISTSGSIENKPVPKQGWCVIS